MSSFPDPADCRLSLNGRIFSHCLFCVSVAVLMIAMIIGTYELLTYVVELSNSGYLAQAAILMGMAFIGSVLFGAIASDRATDCVHGCEYFTARVFGFLNSLLK